MNKRKRVIQKYNGVCQICGKKTNEQIYKDLPELDHIIPKSKGGSNLEENLSLLCKDCNSKKSNIHGIFILEKILKKIMSSYNDFDKKLIDYELRNGNLKDDDIKQFIEALEYQFESIKESLKRGTP